MPLLDHFHPPLSEQRHWEAFHGRWACALADALEKQLPPDYFAEVRLCVRPQTEMSEAEPVWTPPEPPLVIPAAFPDAIEVRIFSSSGGPTLVAAVELVSPRNKARPDVRRAFAAKGISYLSQGIGLVIVDVVTTHQANMHNEIITQLRLSASFLLSADVSLYATAYRPVEREDGGEVHVWPYPLAVGAALPVVPLALLEGPILPLDLEAAYTEARGRLRMP